MAGWVGVSVLSVVAVAIVAAPSSAGAASLPKNLAKFANCPIDDPAVSLCLYSATTSTTFEIGSTTVSTTQPTTLSLGFSFDSNDQPVAVLPDNGTEALQSPSVPLPGGLLGIPGAPDGGPLAVNVTPELVGTPQLSLANLLTKNGPALTLPIDVAISNTAIDLLGDDCSIGDASSPITLNLTTGTTDPPAPNTPIKGKLGKIVTKSNGYLSISKLKLVDNAFAVPGAENCGPGGILDQILDSDKGLPSAAGNNTAILAGASYTAPASLIRKYLG